MPKKKPAIEKPKEPEPEPEPVAEEEEVTCPVCGKPVGTEVTECPHCGAEFEEEEVEEIVEQAAPPAPTPQPKAVVEEPLEGEPVGEDEMAECPVCGKMVSLSVSVCPNCGAEFEEEEVEEVIEVEEKKVPQVAPRAQPRPVPVEYQTEPEEVEAEEEAVETAEPVEAEGPTSILDMRVIGVALIVLGIVGSQISFMIDWYWTWVPPIKSNLGMFIAIPAVVIVVGLLVYLLVKKARGDGKKVSAQMPGMSLSLFLFGILALVMVMLWNPINKALQSSSGGVGAAFVIMLVAGVALYFMKMRSEAKASA